MSRALIPNSTQIPDVILDRFLSELSGAELKVLLYIARRTYGFGKESDTISLRQICEGIKRRDGSVLDTGTGLSRPGAVKAIKALEELGIVIRKHNLREDTAEFEENTYSLNLEWPPAGKDGEGNEVVNEVNHQVNETSRGWSTEFTTGSKLSLPGVVNSVYLQETEQETEQETAARAAAVITALVNRGVNRDTAERLASSHLDECKRQLEYISLADDQDFERDCASYLAVAIPGAFGPHWTYRKRKGKQAEREAQKSRAASKEAHRAKQTVLEEQIASQGRQWIGRVEREQPAAYMAFLEASQGRLLRELTRLQTEGARNTYRRYHASPEKQLELFCEFFSRYPHTPAELCAWIERHAQLPGRSSSVQTSYSPSAL